MSTTIKQYAKINGISQTTARKRLDQAVRDGRATMRRCWQENPKKYFPTYAHLNMPGQWLNVYTFFDE